MTTMHDPDCQREDCWATFTVDGRRGHLQLPGGGTVILQADDLHAEQYLWEVVSSPPRAKYVLTGALRPQAAAGARGRRL